MNVEDVLCRISDEDIHAELKRRAKQKEREQAIFFENLNKTYSLVEKAKDAYHTVIHAIFFEELNVSIHIAISIEDDHVYYEGKVVCVTSKNRILNELVGLLPPDLGMAHCHNFMRDSRIKKVLRTQQKR